MVEVKSSTSVKRYQETTLLSKPRCQASGINLCATFIAHLDVMVYPGNGDAGNGLLVERT